MCQCNVCWKVVKCETEPDFRGDKASTTHTLLVCESCKTGETYAKRLAEIRFMGNRSHAELIEEARKLTLAELGLAEENLIPCFRCKKLLALFDGMCVNCYLKEVSDGLRGSGYRTALGKVFEKLRQSPIPTSAGEYVAKLEKVEKELG